MAYLLYEQDSTIGPELDITTDMDPIKLLWTDPPYGTGKKQKQTTFHYQDPSHPDYINRAISKWLPYMDVDGTVCICLDYRFAASALRSMLDMRWVHRGDIIWEFGLGRPRTSWWPNRHNTIMTFTLDKNSGLFNPKAIPKERRLAPKPGYPDDKPAGSVWNFTMSNTHPDRVGYPNQKPVELIEPFVLAHTNPGDLVADIFCGSSSTGVAAIKNGRDYLGIDSNPDAIAVSEKRLK